MTKPIQRLLLVDDNNADIVLCRIAIERSGLVQELETFAYAEDALDRLRQNTDDKVDAILLDINMPRMNGFEFLETAMAEFGDRFAGVTVAILTTSLAPMDVQTAGRFDNVKHYFDKPLTLEQLRRLSTTVASD